MNLLYFQTEALGIVWRRMAKFSVGADYKQVLWIWFDQIRNTTLIEQEDSGCKVRILGGSKEVVQRVLMVIGNKTRFCKAYYGLFQEANKAVRRIMKILLHNVSFASFLAIIL